MAETIFTHSYLLLILPLLSFVVIALWLAGKYPKMAGQVAILMSALNMLYGLGLAAAYYQHVLSQPELYPDRTLVCFDLAWLNFSPGLTANMGIYLDPISVMMIVVITVISLLVNIYSIGYMKDDPAFGRFFGLMAMFSFSMLGLVVSSNILQLFVFWELVGMSSYALIGFWYEKPSAVAASKKAFIVTRFADAFFLIGILLVSFQAQSFDFRILNMPETAAILNQNIMLGPLPINLLTLATLLIFAGGWGKSAMFPLHIWLPDAMEGPTPVSSIIHSATMVVAGVFLTARMFPLFSEAMGTLALIQFVGAFTAIFAAIIAITQFDIKRILAFSTLSQLGYMLFSLGVAKISLGGESGPGLNSLGYSAAMYHVFTHAFFKCMLFLGAGALIHAVHSNDLVAMGGLKRLMPKTYWSLLAACLAISGIFPFSGFWSKDAILLAALQSGHYVTFGVGLVTGGLTAFYMFRFFFLAFHGEQRSEHHDVHEDPWMTFSIVALTIPTLGAGLLEHFFAGQVVASGLAYANHLAHPSWLPVVASMVGISGIGLAWRFYGYGRTERADEWRQRFGPVYLLVQNKFYIDEIYLFFTRRIIFQGIATPVKWFDRNIVDGAMNLCGWILHLGGKAVRLAQNGQLQFYLGVTALGLAVLLFIGAG
jgi:NADH-quinone oxidoreductase subunit L